MNQMVIGNILNRNIYLINDKNISFYISVPNEEKAAIVINLIDNANEIDISNGNAHNVTNKINEIYSKFNYDNIAVVTPVINNQITEQVKNNAPQYVSYLNKVLGYLINISYRYLKDNGKEVYEQIKLNNNESYKDFNTKFVSMYNNRVELVNYNNPPANKIENTNMPIVENTSIEQNENSNEELANTTTIPLDDAYKEIEQEKENVKKLTRKREPGFVSYVLLGVIVAVISLVVLYLLL